MKPGETASLCKDEMQMIYLEVSDFGWGDEFKNEYSLLYITHDIGYFCDTYYN